MLSIPTPHSFTLGSLADFLTTNPYDIMLAVYIKHTSDKLGSCIGYFGAPCFHTISFVWYIIFRGYVWQTFRQNKYITTHA